MLAFTFAISIATGVLFALLPALETLRVDVNSSLKSGSAGAGFSKGRLRSMLVIGQVALSFALSSAAALLLGSLYKIVHANAGFDASRVAIAPIDLSLEHYSESQGRQFYDDLVAKLSAAPDIEGASLATSVPPTEWPGMVSIFHPGEEPSPEVFQARSFALGLHVNLDAVAPNYFRTLKIPIVAGRDFSEADRGGSPNVVIVSRRLAETMWPHEDAIGKRIAYPRWGGPRRAPFEVIGEAADVKHRSLAGEFPLMLYVPLFIDGYNGRANIVVRTREDAASGVAEIRQAVSQLDSRLPVYFSQTGEQHSADSLWQQRMAAAWIGAFSLLALGMAAMGLYVVIAQSIAQRAREVGIRIALGATRANVVELIMKQALPLALAGIAAGIPAAIGVVRLMRGKLEGIVGAPLPVFVGISVLLMIVMTGAIWIPTRRATRIDPIQALRCD